MLIEPALKVLIAEDNATNVAVVTSMLEAFGCDMMFALDGVEAVDVAMRCQPDLILMDINMPNRDGVDAAVCLRNKLPEPHIPIIAVTGNVTSHTRNRCEVAGFEGFIEKPIDIVLLKDVLDRIAAAR